MVYSVRRRCGQQLAIEAPVEADLVSTVPESATPAALGYAQKVPKISHSFTLNYLLLFIEQMRVIKMLTSCSTR